LLRLRGDDPAEVVMPGLDPGIHQHESVLKKMDCRVLQRKDALCAFARQ
jgi:hypothetical protein